MSIILRCLVLSHYLHTSGLLLHSHPYDVNLSILRHVSQLQQNIERDLGPNAHTHSAPSLLLSDIDGDDKSPLDGDGGDISPRDDVLDRSGDKEKEGEKEGVDRGDRKEEKEVVREEDKKGVKEVTKDVLRTRDEGILLRLTSYASCLISGAR